MVKQTIRFNIYRDTNPNELSQKQLAELEKEINTIKKSDSISDELGDFLLWCEGLPSRQESFAKYLLRQMPKTPGLRVLEVGCGRVAKLSRILNEKGYIMSAMDPKLDLKYCKGFTGIRGKFDYRTIDLSPYDFVVAQEPCDATEHIVRACLEQNVPFIMSLCGVPHKLISGTMPKDVYLWYEYLVTLQPYKMKLRYATLDPFFKTPVLKFTNVE